MQVRQLEAQVTDVLGLEVVKHLGDRMRPFSPPPVSNCLSYYLNADHNRAIDIVLHGMTGKVKVNGNEYNGAMPAMALSNDDIANVLTYLLNSWNNKGGEVSTAQVEDRRKSGNTLNTGGSH